MRHDRLALACLACLFCIQFLRRRRDCGQSRDPLRLAQITVIRIIERKTRFLIMERLTRGKNAEEVAKTVIRLLKPLKKHVKSITTDNGGEFAKHKLISRKLHTSVYFTDPYSSWQKGTVENTNKLIRQYIPKTMNINQLSYNKLLSIQYLLNQRPRKSLLFKSPLSLFYNFAC
ncbi:MAG: IS30 family transposase [Bacteroidota bacterium]